MDLLRAVHGTTTGEAYWGPGDRYTFLVTGDECGGAMFAFDCVVASGGGPPPHRHLAEDELFYLYEGEIDFNADGKTVRVAKGESIFVPKGLAHSYRNVGESNALMLTVYTPAGMEGWFREVFDPVDDPTREPPPVTDEMIARMTAAGPRYNVEWLF